jgi:hypothetical protein
MVRLVVEAVPKKPKPLAERTVEDAYGNTFAAEAVEVMTSEISSVEERVAEPESESVPCKIELPVVVAPPKIVRPVVCPPAPIVVEASDIRPLSKPTSVEVETPYEVTLQGKPKTSSAEA